MIDDATLERLEHEAWRLARSWYAHPSAAEICTYEGHDIAELSELYFGNYFAWFLKSVEAARAIAQRHEGALLLVESAGPQKPRAFFPETGESVMAEACRSAGLSYESVPRGQGSGATRVPDMTTKERLRGLLATIEGVISPPVLRNKPRFLIASATHHVRPLLPELAKRYRLVFMDEEYRAAKWSEALRCGAEYVSATRARQRLSMQARARLRCYEEACAGSVKRYHPHYPWPMEAMGTDLRGSCAERMEYFLKRWAPWTASLIETFSDFFGRRSYAGVLVDEDTVTFRKSLVRVAERCGVPTFQVPHGVAFSGIQYDLFPVSSRRVLVGGDAVRDFYVSKGVPADKISVCGVPRMAVADAGDAGQARRRLSRIYGLDLRQPWVLVATTTLFPMEVRRRHSENARALTDTAAALSDQQRPLQVLLRTHPLDIAPGRSLERFVSATKLRCVLLDGRASATESIAACDMVLSFPSNLVIEALLALKPTGVLDYFKLARSGITYFGGEGSWMMASDRDGLTKLCAGLLKADESVLTGVRRARDWFRERWVGAAGNGTVDRVIRAIDDGVRDG